MSDTMMFGIAKMPYEMAMRDEMSRRQFHANTQRLAAALEAALVDAERYRWALNNSCWIRGEHAAYVAIPVARDADLSCVAMRDAAIDEAMAKENNND